jgi:hypothetical protein
MLHRPLLAALLCAMLCAGCARLSLPVVVTPKPSEALLLPCRDPMLPDPETATDNQVGAALLDLAKAYADCKQRHASLATFVRGKP